MCFYNVLPWTFCSLLGTWRKLSIYSPKFLSLVTLLFWSFIDVHPFVCSPNILMPQIRYKYMLGNRIIDDSTVINKMYLRPMYAHTDRKRNRNCTGELERERNSEKSIITQQFACKRVYVSVLNQKKKKKIPPWESDHLPPPLNPALSWNLYNMLKMTREASRTSL